MLHLPWDKPFYISTSVVKLLSHKVGMFYLNTLYNKCKYKLEATKFFKILAAIYISFCQMLHLSIVASPRAF